MSCHIKLFYVMSYHIILCHVISYYFMSCHIILFYVMSYYILLYPDMAKLIDLRGVKIGVKWRIFFPEISYGGYRGYYAIFEKKTLFCLNLTKLTLV